MFLAMKHALRSIRWRLLASAFAATAGAVLPAAPAAAQGMVQAVPARESAQLSAAMRRLAQRPTDLDALVSAGNAALALRDAGAAAGFFTRAAAVAPGDARVLVGQARVALEQRRPVAALQAFAQAEQAGARPLDMAADRALAYDLVGDNAAAQALYRSIMTSGDSAEVRRRLALSLAIAGNRAEFEKTLYPLLRDEDRSAFRTRAFGLAILGSTDDAVEIADAMMPTDLALRMAPYLRYMPRLTKAQQAAAGNLGAFPAATEIGRDSADVASYTAAGARIAARADASLTPTGAALGRRVAQAPVQPALAAQAKSQPARSLQAAPATRTPTSTQNPPATRVALADPAPARRAPPPSAVPPPAATPVIVPAQSAPALSAPAPAEPARLSLAEAFADLGAAPPPAAVPSAGAVDVAKLASARAAADAKTRREAEAKAKRDADAKAKRDAEAKVKREAEAKLAKARAEQAAKDAEPARRWIQVGVGRNVAAFSFDWKKLAKQADGALDGKGPWAVKYGATNRMLAGPYPTEAAARAALKRLQDKDIDALPYSSAQGEKVSKPG